jgi:hypothetical protein
LKVFFEAKMLFVEADRTVEVAHVNSNVVNALEHRCLLKHKKHRLGGGGFASLPMEREKSRVES